MFSAAPWTAFLLLITLEVLAVVALRVGLGAVGALLHRHDAVRTSLD